MPPCISTMWRTMARPSPNPPVCRVVPASAWRNRSKTYGRKSGRDANAAVADADLDMRVHAFETHLHAPFFRRELHGVRDQIPDDLVQPSRIAGHGADPWVDHRLDAYAFGVGGRLDGGHGVVDDQRQFHRLHIQTNLSGHDPGDVEDVLHDLRQPRRVPFERLETSGGLLA